MLNSIVWDCIPHENIYKSHLNEYGLNINRTECINLAKNPISRIRKFWYYLQSKNKKKFSPAPSVRNSVQQELDSNIKSDSVKLFVEQLDDDMLRLRKLYIKNPNKIIIAHLNLIRNKFKVLSLLFHGVIDLWYTKLKSMTPFPRSSSLLRVTLQYRLDRNDRSERVMLIVKDNLLSPVEISTAFQTKLKYFLLN